MFFKLCNILVITSLLVNSIEGEVRQKLPYHFDTEANENLCNFFDTINITGGIKNSDNSITFENVRYTKQDYGTFHYIYLPNQIKITVPPHERGCVCKYKSCVRLCCPYAHSFYDTVVENQKKHKCGHNSLLKSIDVNLFSDEKTKRIDLMHYPNLTLVSEKPCKTAFFLDPSTDSQDEWHILPNGSIYFDETHEEHDAYCLAHAFNQITGTYEVKALLCTPEVPNEASLVGVLIYPAVMLVSVVFLSLTLFVYIWIEELRRTIHGKNLMCYLVTLIVGYSFLAFTHIDNSHAFGNKTKCLILAEIIHTAFIFGFIWLGIISYDIWKTIGRTDNHRHQFCKYCMFSCGITFLIVLITNILDNVNILESQYRPGLGESVCWLQDSKYAHFLYLYSIIIIVITTNSVLFLLTKFKIEHVKRISHRATTSEGSRKFSREETDADRFGLFLRLFIIMGLPWIIEIISWLLDLENILVYILDVTTMLQGPIIFFLFIKKRRVKKLIKRKLSTISFLSNQVNRHSNSVINSSSAMTTLTSGMKLDDIKLNEKS